MKSWIIPKLGSITRKLGVPRGGQRLLNLAFPPARFTDGDDMIVEYDRGLWLCCNLRSYLERQIFFYGYYDQFLERTIGQMLKVGGIAFDCGANVGMYTLRMAAAVGAQGKVIAVEPHDQVRSRLIGNIRLNGFTDRVCVQACAVSKNAGSTLFSCPPPQRANQGNASLFVKNSDWTTKKIATKSIDNITNEENLPNVHFIRADVQGAELQLLQGALSCLKEFHPVISMRYNKNIARAAGLHHEDLVGFLTEMGYQLFMAKRGMFECVRVEDLNRIANAELFFL